jgi:hypothetical protein
MKKAIPTPPPGPQRRLEYMRLTDLKPASQNPKRHAHEEIGTSIGRFGYVEPVVLDERTGKLVAGHGRVDSLKARQASGEAPPEGVREEGVEWLVPVLRGWASRSDTEAQAYLLASNQLTAAGGWDDAELGAMLRELEAQQALEGVGFDEQELARLLAEAQPGALPSVSEARQTLAERFVVPPFSVLDARQGYWQERKRAWLALGIQSELGRGGGHLAAVRDRQPD